MRFFLVYLFLFTSALLWANEFDFAREIQHEENQTTKEKLLLEWLNELSQTNTLKLDSIIQIRHSFLQEISFETEFKIFVIASSNAILNGRFQKKDIQAFQLKEQDKILLRLWQKFMQKDGRITNNEIQQLQEYAPSYNLPTEQIIYQMIFNLYPISSTDSITSIFNKILASAENNPIKSLKSALYNSLGLLLYREKKYDLAVRVFQEGIQYTQQHQLHYDQAVLWYKVGRIYFRIDHIEKAKEAFERANALLEESSQQLMLGKLNNALGEIYSQQGIYKKSIDYYKKALFYFYPIQFDEGLADAHKNMGKAFFETQNYDIASRNYELSEQYYHAFSNPEKEGEVYYYQAELFLQKNHLEKAQEKINHALELWESIGHIKDIQRVYQFYIHWSQAKKDVPLENYYLHKYVQYSDSIKEFDIDFKANQLYSHFKIQENEQLIEEQQQIIEQEVENRLNMQNQLLSAEIQNRNIILLTILIVLFFTALILYLRARNKQEQLRKKQNELELQQALLRTQMNPHFIFNTLSVIQSYIYNDDIDNSTQVLVHFSRLIRLILENSAKEFIPLEKEMEIINRYLILQKIRFENRFEVEIDNQIEDTFNIQVPPMLIQPFIENAIEHAGLERIKEGRIKISYAIQEDLIIFMIEDNGIGREASKQEKKIPQKEDKHNGMAIKFTEDRINLINQKYKSKGSIKIEDVKETAPIGTRVTIQIPYQIKI